MIFRCCRRFAALALLFTQAAEAAAPANATVALDHLREFLPDAETAPDATLREALPGHYARYSENSGLLLAADGRYFFFQWSETGPVTRNSDTGRWFVYDGMVELEARAANAVIRDGPRRFLPVKLPSWGTAQWFLIEASQQFDRLLAAEAGLRIAKGEEAARQPNVGTSPAQSLLELGFALRGDRFFGENLSIEVEVAEALNRDAAAWPVPNRPFADFVLRAKRFVPTITAPTIRHPADLAGQYLSDGFEGVDVVYLLPDGSYYYHYEYLGCSPAYVHGTWAVHDNLVELSGAVGLHPEARFFVIRAPGQRRADRRDAPRLQLVGSEWGAGSFLRWAALQEAAILTGQRSGQATSSKPGNPLRSHALTLETSISAGKGEKLRRYFDFANQLVADFKIEWAEGDLGGGKRYIFAFKPDLTVDGIHFFSAQIEAQMDPTRLKLSSPVRAEVNGSVQTLPTTTLYLEGTKITGASPRFEVGGRAVGPPGKKR